MIDDPEIRDIAAQLGVPENQVRRDHLLSHLIQALEGNDQMVFIGGTGLNRTHLASERLSEDIDLHLLEGKADDVVGGLLDAVRLEFPEITSASNWRYEDVSTHVLGLDDLRVQIQLISRRYQWTKLPAEITPVRLKYSDLPDTVNLMVPTSQAFGAMKLTAYVDRVAPRDLFDLKKLAERGMLGDESIALARELLGRSLAKQEFTKAPTDDQWNAELSHQVADPGTPSEALDIVFRVLAECLGW
jgi:predicted nucleotidyltransferase component of viral defense system